jgi:hypothetical protein
LVIGKRKDAIFLCIKQIKMASLKTLDTPYWMLDAGCWILDAGICE